MCEELAGWLTLSLPSEERAVTSMSRTPSRGLNARSGEADGMCVWTPPPAPPALSGEAVGMCVWPPGPRFRRSGAKDVELVAPSSSPVLALGLRCTPPSDAPKSRCRGEPPPPPPPPLVCRAFGLAPAKLPGGLRLAEFGAPLTWVPELLAPPAPLNDVVPVGPRPLFGGRLPSGFGRMFFNERGGTGHGRGRCICMGPAAGAKASPAGAGDGAGVVAALVLVSVVSAAGDAVQGQGPAAESVPLTGDGAGEGEGLSRTAGAWAIGV